MGEGQAYVALLFKKKKKNLWELQGQDENKETKEFVRPFYLLILPALFLSVLKCTLVFLKLEPLAVSSLIPKWLMYCFYVFALVSSSPGNTEQEM